MTHQDTDVLVLGAGIVGICNAIALNEKGFNVTLVDRDEPSEATSFGNAGVISQWACIPQSMPGLWKKVPKWLLDPSGPLSIRWSIKPYSLTLAWVAKEFIRPALGPSGVSIGHNLP